MSVKWRARGRYDVASSEIEDRSEVEVDDSRPLDVCTVDEAVEKIGFGVFQVIAMSFAGLIWAAVAMEILLLIILSPIVKCEWNLSTVQEASLTAAVFIGFFFGSNFWRIFTKFYGQKWGLFFVALLSSCFGIMSAFSPNFGMMIFLRTMLGFTGAGSRQGIALTTEYCPAKYRRIATLLAELFWVAGAIGIVALGWATVPTLGWRWLLGFAAIPVTVMTFFIPLMPSSPRYLIIKGKREQALRNINIVARMNCKPKLYIKLVTDQEKAEMDIQDSLSEKAEMDIQDSLSERAEDTKEVSRVEVEEKKGDNSSDVVTIPTNMQPGTFPTSPGKSPIFQMLLYKIKGVCGEETWKTTFLLLFVWVLVEAYYYGIILLTTSLFQYDKHCSFSGSCYTSLDICKTLEDDDYSALLWTSVAEVPGIFLAMLLLVTPCFGRKIAMATEFGLLTLCTGVLLICANRTILTIILFICRGLIVSAFQTVHLYTSEVYSPTAPDVGVGLCVTVGHIGGILTPYVAQTLLSSSDTGGILIFVAMASFAGIFSGILPNDTRSRALKVDKCIS